MRLLAKERRILLKHIETPELHTLRGYESTGGYGALKKALGMAPDQIIDEVKKSGLRGRGGAGFPTGMKWGFVPFNSGKPIYLLCNADESEPGCFKDRLIIERNPHSIIEGIIIASYAVRCHKSYIYIRGEYAHGARVLQKAVEEAYAKGYLGKDILGSKHQLDLVVHRGAGAYICGEETGLISSLEGKKGYPKLKPPFPAVSGFLNCPTVVNNVETLATVPWIVEYGGGEYAKYGYGNEKSRGTRLFCLSGWVNRPGVYEEEMGMPLKDFIEHYGGGMKDGAKLKAVIPGGSSTPPLTAAEVDTAVMDYEAMAAMGTFLGAGGIIVIPEHYPLVKLLERISEFYWDESCGQCTPCREGTGWLYKMVARLEHGTGTLQDISDMKSTAQSMMGTTICALSDAAAMPVLGFLKKFPQEFEAIANAGSHGKAKTINLNINGKAVEAEPGMTVFQAAAKEGIFIPHYCYHPDLSIAGVCRMCTCEIEKNPRLQISCNTTVAEGMVVRTDTDKVKSAVKSALELHLINHPLDCPICDKAGECKLQDFYRDYGLYESRMEFEAKVHKPKVVDIGTIVLDSERCILCTRCVRFTAEVTQTHELGIFGRGDRSTLKTYDDGPLRNDYTGNLADICPVGALTAKDFRFQCRVWFLDKVDSVCTLCAHGCNTTVSVNPATHKLYRVEPRRNVEINKSWICDTGRWDYHHVYKENRLKVPKLRLDGVMADFTWHEAFGILHDEIREAPDRVCVVMSTQMTNEEIWDAVQSFVSLGVSSFAWVVDEDVVNETKPFDGLLKHHDLTPNAAGFRQVMSAANVAWHKIPQIGKLLKEGKFDRMIVLGLEGEVLPGLGRLLPYVPKTCKIAFHATNDSGFFEMGDILLPNVSAYEKSGTVVNPVAIAQKLKASIPWQHTARDGHAVAWGITRGHDREKFPPTRWKQIAKDMPEGVR